MIKKILLVLTLGVLMFSLFGCQTVKGLGEDITSVGEAGADIID